MKVSQIPLFLRKHSPKLRARNKWKAPIELHLSTVFKVVEWLARQRAALSDLFTPAQRNRTTVNTEEKVKV